MTVRDPEPDDKAPHPPATLARLAVSAAAAQLIDKLLPWVPIDPNELTTSGRQHRTPPDHTRVGEARNLVEGMKQLLSLVVTYERVSGGASWDVIGRDFGEVRRQSVIKRFRDAVAEFEAALANPEAVDEHSSHESRLPAGADAPGVWGSKLDKWCREHRPPCDPAYQDNAVTAGMTRLAPLLELMDVQSRRHALITKLIVPPPGLIAPLLERELELQQQLGAAGHDTTDDVARLQDTLATLHAAEAGAGDAAG